MLFGKKKPTKARTEQEELQEAILQVGAEQQKAHRRRGRRGRKLLPSWLDKRVVWGLATVLVVVIGDAVRRENQEFAATLTGFQGQVTIQETATSAGVPAKANQRLADRMVVNTGPGAWATVEFVDHGVMALDQNTALTVKLMEYSRGGRWRMRSFSLRAGRLWAHVGSHFGAQSEQRVYTPSAVAAVRGTVYAVSYDPTAATTAVQCGEGYVTTQGFTGPAQGVNQGGETTVAYGRPVEIPHWMRPADQQGLSQDLLTRPIPPELWLKTAELTITQLLDAPLSILGIGKCSWGVGGAEMARRAAAEESLRQIMALLEGSEKFPEFVNPETLRELGLSERDARRILRNFNGDALLRYDPLEDGRSYRILAEARDKRRTTYVLTPMGLILPTGAAP